MAVEENSVEVDDRDGSNDDRLGCSAGEAKDTENVTSLEVEWLQQTLNIAAPFSAGVLTHQTVMSHYQTLAGDNQTPLPTDFGESLPPRLTGLVNKQFRMLRLVKEPGNELGVLITKKFNKDKRTTGYIIAYIEPRGLVDRLLSENRNLIIYVLAQILQTFFIRITTIINIFRHQVYTQPILGEMKIVLKILSVSKTEQAAALHQPHQ